MKIILVFGLLAVGLGQQSRYYSFHPEDIRNGFIAVDLNGDGIVTRDEVVKIFRSIDVNGDGFLTFSEYKLYRPLETPEKVIKGEFKYCDKLDGENDERISLAQVDRIITILDSDKDGAVSLAEFLKNLPQILDAMTQEIDAIIVVG